MRWSADTGRWRGRYKDRLLLALGVALAVTTVVAIAAPLLGLDHPRSAGTRRTGLAAGIGLVWIVLVCGVFWRSRAYIRRLSAQATATDDRLADLAATTHEWMWESDTRFVLISCGPAVARLLGYPPAELIGRSMFDFMEPTDAARARAIITAALEERTGWTDVSIAWRHADGHLIAMTGSARPVYGTRGQIIGFRGTRGPGGVDLAAGTAVAAVARHVRDVIDTRALAVALQPVVDLSDSQWISVEALARFADRTPPAVAFARAAEAGLGVDLELLAIDMALQTADALPPNIALSINASPACIVDPRFTPLLEHAAVGIDRLIVEVTEHTAVGCYDDITQVLLPLRRRGLRIAVDDAGAGYASFRHVLALRPDVIKLDRSLISEIDTDQARRSFVTAIMIMALDLGATVTAEGVERPEELQVLVALGVDHAQGFLICPPQTQTEQWARWPSAPWSSTEAFTRRS